MFFENELTRTLTLIEFMLVVLIGLAPVALTIWMKLVLDRRRVAEDERDSPARADYQSRDAAESAGGISDDTAPPVFQVPPVAHRPQASRDIRSEQTPRALCRAAPGRGALKSENEKEENQ